MTSADSTDRAIAHQTKQILRGAGAQLAGKKRGPDPEVRRDSFDVDDARAKPWAKIGDGSIAHGLMHREALLQAADEFYNQEWRELPAAAVREARARRDAMAAEMAGYAVSAPVGRPATLRQEIARIDAFLGRARQRLRRVDLTVLKALLKRLDFATGKLFPCLDTIAGDAGCHRNAAIAALRRLKAHGFIAWVRRSIATGNQGQFAPQREQTSNAYFFEHRARMPRRVWLRFQQLLTAKLRRLGAIPAALRPGEPPTPKDTPLRAALASLGALVTNAST